MTLKVRNPVIYDHHPYRLAIYVFIKQAKYFVIKGIQKFHKEERINDLHCLYFEKNGNSFIQNEDSSLCP